MLPIDLFLVMISKIKIYVSRDYFLNPLNLIGILFLISGLTVTFISNFILLKGKTSVTPFDTPSVFITTGPFKLSRNPNYPGMTVALLGVEIFLGSLFPLIFPIIFVIIINKLIIPLEEKNLETIFGEKYPEYKNKVRRWI